MHGRGELCSPAGVRRTPLRIRCSETDSGAVGKYRHYVDGNATKW